MDVLELIPMKGQRMNGYTYPRPWRDDPDGYWRWVALFLRGCA
jgi:hypothetical protein